MRKNQWIFILPLTLVFLFYNATHKKQAILSDMKFAEGHCVELDCYRKKQCTIIATFKVRGKEYEARSYSNFRYMQDLDRIKDIKLNIVYHRLDPNDSYILIRKSDFEEFGLELPDTSASVYYRVSGSNPE